MSTEDDEPGPSGLCNENPSASADEMIEKIQQGVYALSRFNRELASSPARKWIAIERKLDEMVELVLHADLHATNIAASERARIQASN